MISIPRGALLAGIGLCSRPVQRDEGRQVGLTML